MITIEHQTLEQHIDNIEKLNGLPDFSTEKEIKNMVYVLMHDGDEFDFRVRTGYILLDVFGRITIKYDLTSHELRTQKPPLY